jgi:hypothetical protein
MIEEIIFYNVCKYGVQMSVEMKDETEEQGEVVSEAVINCDENATLSSKEPTAIECCDEADTETNLTKC